MTAGRCGQHLKRAQSDFPRHLMCKVAYETWTCQCGGARITADSLSKWIHLLRVERRQIFTCAVATWTVAPPMFVVIVADKPTSTILAFSVVLSRSSFLCALCWDFGHWTPNHVKKSYQHFHKNVQCSPSKHETHMPRAHMCQGSLQDRVAPKAISIRSLLKLWSHSKDGALPGILSAEKSLPHPSARRLQSVGHDQRSGRDTNVVFVEVTSKVTCISSVRFHYA